MSHDPEPLILNWPCRHCGVDWAHHGGLDHEYERADVRPIAGGGGLAAAIPLAQLLLPLLPGLIQSVAALVETSRTHAETPGPAKEDLSAVSTQLDELVRLVQQVRV